MIKHCSCLHDICWCIMQSLHIFSPSPAMQIRLASHAMALFQDLFSEPVPWIWLVQPPSFHHLWDESQTLCCEDLMYNLFRFIIYLVYLQKLKDLGKITVLQRSDKRRVLYFKDTSADVEYNVDEGNVYLIRSEQSYLFGRYKNMPVSGSEALAYLKILLNLLRVFTMTSSSQIQKRPMYLV